MNAENLKVRSVERGSKVCVISIGDGGQNFR